VLSILQMPSGVPVATVALNGAKNAGILAAQIVGANNETVSNTIATYKNNLSNEVNEKVNKLKSDWNNSFDI
jgi:5-(carboxyamino)imidazole ribonucleotide mutase